MKKMGDHRRVSKVEREIQNVIGMYLISGFSKPTDYFLTISRVILSNDLKSGKIYFSMISKGQESLPINSKTIADVEALLNSGAFEIQSEVAHKLKLRFTPKLKFFFDETTEKVLKVESILHQISSDRDKK